MHRSFSLIALACLTAANAFADYTGTPFYGTPLNVPGTVEAEDYDLGGEGVAYQWGTAQGGDTSYREDAKGIGNGGSGHNLGWTDNGIWTRYTIMVTEEGDYRVDVVCSAGSDNGKFDLKVDDVTACRVQTVENLGWDNYFTVPVEGIHLTAGQHVFTFNCYGGMNCDKFIFTRTGELTGNYENGSYTYNYPMTQTYEGNPLFVDFPSPLFGQEDGFPGNLYTADPSARVWNIDGEDVLYVYASHDMEPAVGCDRMDRYHVFSTKDMVEWTDHGEILNAAQVNAQMGFTCPGFMWAPDCVYNPADQLYYYYFPHPTDGNDWGGTFRIFVATSPRPDGGFTVKKVIDGLPPRIDPNVFVDDDGQPYIYVGGGAHPYGCKLKKDDWTTLDGEPVEMTGMEDFHEGIWVFKHDGRYYITYPDNHSPQLGGNRMRWATSTSPLGPWTPGGIYMYPHGEETAHGSVVKFKGQYYQFYHTGNYSGEGTLRSVCVDKLEIDADGRLLPVRNWGTPRSGQLPQVSQSLPLSISAVDYNLGGSHYGYFKRPGREMTTAVVDGRECLTAMTRKEWVRYSVEVTESGRYSLSCTLRREGSQTARFLLAIDGSNVSATETEATADWLTATFRNIELEPGEHYIELRPTQGYLTVADFRLEASQNTIPGIVEAEDYDDNRDGYQGYSFKQGWKGNDKSYRQDQGVSINVSGGVRYIGDTQVGDWLNYTLQAPEGGIFTVNCILACGNDGGRFYVTLDDEAVRSATIATGNTGGWGSFTSFTALQDVTLSRGQHVFTFHVAGDVNIDRYEFIRTANDPAAVLSPYMNAAAAAPTWYTMQGQRVQRPVRGLYIVEGRKQIVR